MGYADGTRDHGRVLGHHVRVAAKGYGASRSDRFLATVGVLLLMVAAAGFLLDKSEALVGGFLIVGAALVLVSVLAPRLEGKQKLGLTGAELNLAYIVESTTRAEIELKSGRLPGLEDVL
jgi:hypothetical protein